MEYRARNLDRALAYRAAYKARELQLAKDRHAADPAPRRASVRKWQQANPDKVRARNVAEYHSAPDKHRARVKAWTRANPEKVLSRAREWREKNPEKAKMFRDESVRRWNAKYPDRRAAYVRGYQAAKLNATPAWAKLGAIMLIYEAAARATRDGGVPHVVDHIVPLKSKLVCGLHVEHNLQVITGTANSAKGNRHWPDMPSLTYTALSA